MNRPWTSPIIQRTGPDPDAVARLVRQGVIPDPTLPVAPPKPKRRRVERTGWDVDQALTLARSGFAADYLAEMFGVWPTTIRKQLAKRGFHFPRKSWSPLTQGDIDLMRSLVASGVTRNEVGRRLGHSKSTVCRHTDDLPSLVGKTDPRRIPDEVAAAMRDRLAQGVSRGQVAREFGVVPASVSRCVRRLEEAA